MSNLLFYSEDNGVVIVCPPMDPGEDALGETFWPVFHGGAFCGLSYSELRDAGNGTLALDARGRARIDTQ